MGKPTARAKPALRLVDCELQRMKSDQEETISVLRGALAEAEQGKMPHGFVMYFVDAAGQGQVVRTRQYRRNPQDLSLAGFQLQCIAAEDSGSSE